jgi:hypothetical protein
VASSPTLTTTSLVITLIHIYLLKTPTSCKRQLPTYYNKTPLHLLKTPTNLLKTPTHLQKTTSYLPNNINDGFSAHFDDHISSHQPDPYLPVKDTYPPVKDNYPPVKDTYPPAKDN